MECSYRVKMYLIYGWYVTSFCTHAHEHTHIRACVQWIRFLFVSFSFSLDLILDCFVSHCFVYSFVKRRRASISTNQTKSHVYTYTYTSTTIWAREKRRTHTNTLKFNSPSMWYLLYMLSYICRGQNPFASVLQFAWSEIKRINKTHCVQW